MKLSQAARHVNHGSRGWAPGFVGGRTYVRSMSRTELQDAVSALRAAFDAVAACDLDLLTRDELVEVMDELESLGCQLPGLGHRLLTRLQTETTAREMGAKSWKDVLRIRWRISTSEANRRLTEAAVLAPGRVSLTV